MGLRSGRVGAWTPCLRVCLLSKQSMAPTSCRTATHGDRGVGPREELPRRQPRGPSGSRTLLKASQGRVHQRGQAPLPPLRSGTWHPRVSFRGCRVSRGGTHRQHPVTRPGAVRARRPSTEGPQVNNLPSEAETGKQTQRPAEAPPPREQSGALRPQRRAFRLLVSLKSAFLTLI